MHSSRHPHHNRRRHGSQNRWSKHNENQVEAKGQQEDIRAYLHSMAEEDMYHKTISIVIRWSNLNENQVTPCAKPDVNKSAFNHGRRTQGSKAISKMMRWIHMQSQRPTIIHSGNPPRSVSFFMKQMKSIPTQRPKSNTFLKRSIWNLNHKQISILWSRFQHNYLQDRHLNWNINHQTPIWYFNHKQVYIIMVQTFNTTICKTTTWITSIRRKAALIEHIVKTISARQYEEHNNMWMLETDVET